MGGVTSEKKLHHFEQPKDACTASHKRAISSQCAGSAGRSSLKRMCTVMASAPLFSQTCMKSRVFSWNDDGGEGTNAGLENLQEVVGIQLRFKK